MLSPVRDNSFFRMEFCGTVLRADFISKSALWRICSVTVNVFFMSLGASCFHASIGVQDLDGAILVSFLSFLVPIAFACHIQPQTPSIPIQSRFNPIQSRQIFPLTCRVTRYLVLTALMFCVREGILDEESRPLPCADPKQLHFEVTLNDFCSEHHKKCWSLLQVTSAWLRSEAPCFSLRQEISDMARAGETGSSRSSRRDAWRETKTEKVLKDATLIE